MSFLSRMEFGDCVADVVESKRIDRITVVGPRRQTPALAAHLRSLGWTLRKGGFSTDVDGNTDWENYLLVCEREIPA